MGSSATDGIIRSSTAPTGRGSSYGPAVPTESLEPTTISTTEGIEDETARERLHADRAAHRHHHHRADGDDGGRAAVGFLPRPGRAAGRDGRHAGPGADEAGGRADAALSLRRLLQ